MKKPLVYVFGPYSNGGKITDRVVVDANVNSARDLALSLWNVGAAVICPHANTYNFDLNCNNTLAPSEYVDGDLEMVSKCDFGLATSGWEASQGAIREYTFMQEHGISVVSFSDLCRIIGAFQDDNYEAILEMKIEFCPVCNQYKESKFMQPYNTYRICKDCFKRLDTIGVARIDKFTLVPKY